jgi:hypothetical protein
MSRHDAGVLRSPKQRLIVLEVRSSRDASVFRKGLVHGHFSSGCLFVFLRVARRELLAHAFGADCSLSNDDDPRVGH